MGKRTCARDWDVFFLAMDGGTVLGCVRYCVEEGTPMLRRSYLAQVLRPLITSSFFLRSVEPETTMDSGLS